MSQNIVNLLLCNTTMTDINVLIINEIANHVTSSKNHFSLTKGESIAFYMAQISDIKVYFLTTGNEETKNSIIYKSSFDLDFLKNLKVILFIRETNIHTVLDKYKTIKKYLDDQYIKTIKNTKVGIKGDSLAWLNNKELKTWVKKEYDLELLEWGYNFFSVIYVQMEKSIPPAMKLLKKDPLSKLKTSKMGVPNEHYDMTMIENYFEKTKYIDSIVSRIDIAFNPLKLTAGFKALTVHDPPCNIDKPYIIIYTGRIKTDGGRIGIMMSEIMKKLGNNYQLHIFPGRFVIPGSGIKACSPKNMAHLQFLRDTVFYKNENVYIHYPFEHGKRLNYLLYANVGLDFSPTRPSNNVCPYGNSKLLDYCYAGIPVVTEENVGNVHLVKEAANGIILSDMASIDDYVTAIKLACTMKVDKKRAIRITIENNNWYSIAENILNDFGV